MFIFHITTTTSRFTTTGNAFGPPGDDTPGADTLIVDPNAFLITTGALGNGADLANTGAWNVTINGSIISVDPTKSGIRLDGLNAALSAIKIGVDGSVQGNGAGIDLESSASINNAGRIIAEQLGHAIEIINDGTHTITNSGEISGAAGAAIVHAVGTSNDTVKNSGTISGNVFLSNGNDTVTNSGVISHGQLSLGDGTNRLTNSGVISDDIICGIGSDTLTDFSILADGSMKSGKITGTISLGAGDDKFTGGANSETVQEFTLVGGVLRCTIRQRHHRRHP